MRQPLFSWVLVSLVGISVEGYDGYTTCSKPMRAPKSRADFPCDFSTQTWCTIPGSYYPWRAVRRFVYENHGLMRRMYGDERHISVLRSEIESNDVEYHAEDWASSQAGILNNLKHYKLKKEEYKTSSSSTTVKTTTTTAPSTTTATLPTTQKSSGTLNQTTTLGSDSLNNITTTVLPEALETTVDTTEDDEDSTSTQLFDDLVDSTTFGYDTSGPTTTPPQDLDETSPPPSTTQEKIQIFQDTLEKTQSTTEEQQIMYKTKGVNACPVKEEVVAPFWANNTRGEVLALLNLYPFEQYVHWERCTYENRQMFCRQGCKCEQQYRLHRLLAYDPTNDCRGIFSDWFKFPSCCVCRCYDLPSEFRLTSRSPRNTAKRRNYS